MTFLWSCDLTWLLWEYINVPHLIWCHYISERLKYYQALKPTRVNFCFWFFTFQINLSILATFSAEWNNMYTCTIDNITMAYLITIIIFGIWSNIYFVMSFWKKLIPHQHLGNHYSIPITKILLIMPKTDNNYK